MAETVSTLDKPDLQGAETQANRASLPPRFMAVLREPLVHFLLLGALLFGLYGLVNGSTPGLATPSHIEVDAPAIARLKADWQRQWGGEPTPAELQTLIDQYIHDEVFYREALALGFDQNDIIVRRRLIQKMEFLAEDVSALREPTDEELQVYLADHGDRYYLPGRVSFAQVYFSGELRGDRAEAEAQTVLNQLRANPQLGQSKKPLGDRTMLPVSLTLASGQTLTNAFGVSFAQALAAVTELGWQGPFPSVYGTHLVNVTEREPGHGATLAEVRGAVRLDWLNDQRQQHETAVYQQLRDRYKITISPAALETPTVQAALSLEVD